MDFNAVLKNVSDKVGGAYGATIMGYDGIALQDYLPEGSTLDMDVLGVEYSKVLTEVKNASEVLELGNVEELVITTLGTKIILRAVTSDYFMALIMPVNGNSGKAKFFLKKAVKEIMPELR